MNIWIVNHYIVTPDQPGGTRHHNLARRLQAKGHRVTLFASNYSYLNRVYAAEGFQTTGKLDTHDGVDVCWIHTLAYNRSGIGRFLGMLQFAWALGSVAATMAERQRPDVIVGSSPHLFAAFAAMRCARKLGVPFVLEIRDIWPESLVELGHFSRLHPMIVMMAALERRLCTQSDRIVTVLPDAARYLAESFGRTERDVLWLPNFVDLEGTDPPPEAVAKGRLEFMYAGAIGVANGLDAVVAAAEIVSKQLNRRDIVVKLVGDGPRKSELKRMVAERGIDNVEFVDAVPKSAIRRVLATADFFLMTLVDAGVFKWGISPNKLFDYMSVGRPIVFGVRSSNNPVSAAGAGLTVPPDQPQALADAMVTLAGLDEAERRAMGQRALAYVREHHELGALAERLDGFLREVVA